MSQTLPILIVEDDADLRDAVRDTLELSGHAVVAVSGGAEALEVLERQPVCLVVSDVRMEPIDGIALLKEIYEKETGLPPPPDAPAAAAKG